MCILNDSLIRRLIKDLALVSYYGGIKESQIQAASVDLRLGARILLDTGPVGLVCRSLPFDLPPGGFALGSTLETITLPDRIQGQVVGKSSLGRRGLAVEFAGFLDPGFSGQVTLELVNLSRSPIQLLPGMLIAQVAFQLLSGKAERPYGSPGLGSHYQGQSGPTAAKD